jgi:hypothetical protein
MFVDDPASLIGPVEAAWADYLARDAELAREVEANESAPQFAEDLARRPYREVLWQASRAVYDALAGKKRVVAPDFTIFPIDDHGDIDAAEDVRQSLPPEAAATVLRRA